MPHLYPSGPKSRQVKNGFEKLDNFFSFLLADNIQPLAINARTMAIQRNPSLLMQVCQWLLGIGAEQYISKFLETGVTGSSLLVIESRQLKAMGITGEAKSRMKRKLKELRALADKEKRQNDKQRREKEKLLKKAEKLAEKASRKK